MVMRPNAQHIQEAMLTRWPALRSSWHFVEASSWILEPDPSCLLLAVHGCNVISDSVIALAMSGSSPVAIMPCCHTKRSLKMWQEELQQPKEVPTGPRAL